jgi:hypothetical protein
MSFPPFIEDETTSIFGHYETRSALVRDVQLSLLATLKGKEDPTSLEMAEFIVDLIIIPLLQEFHE